MQVKGMSSECVMSDLITGKDLKGSSIFSGDILDFSAVVKNLHSYR